MGVLNVKTLFSFKNSTIIRAIIRPEKRLLRWSDDCAQFCTIGRLARALTAVRVDNYSFPNNATVQSVGACPRAPTLTRRARACPSSPLPPWQKRNPSRPTLSTPSVPRGTRAQSCASSRLERRRHFLRLKQQKVCWSTIFKR